MSTKPKFSVGDRVQILHPNGYVFVDDTFIIDVVWVDDAHPTAVGGWWYRVIDHPKYGFGEPYLRRRPDDDEISDLDWEGLKRNLGCETESA